jgi:hypothetical protein
VQRPGIEAVEDAGRGTETALCRVSRGMSEVGPLAVGSIAMGRHEGIIRGEGAAISHGINSDAATQRWAVPFVPAAKPGKLHAVA